MDQYLSNVIIALITGVFSFITLFIQKKSDKITSKIDEHKMFIEKEKSIKSALDKSKREKELIIYDIIILILDTNLQIIKNTDDRNFVDESVFQKSIELKHQFEEISEKIDDIKKQYEMLMEMGAELQQEIDRQHEQSP